MKMKLSNVVLVSVYFGIVILISLYSVAIDLFTTDAARKKLGITGVVIAVTTMISTSPFFSGLNDESPKFRDDEEYHRSQQKEKTIRKITLGIFLAAVFL